MYLHILFPDKSLNAPLSLWELNCQIRQFKVRGRRKERTKDGFDSHQGGGPRPPRRRQAPQWPRASRRHKVSQEKERQIPQKVHR